MATRYLADSHESATIYAEVLGLGSSNVADEKLRGKCDVALERAMKSAIRDAGKSPADVGHAAAHRWQ